MNASITKFRILACPFDRAQRDKNNMEVSSFKPTSFTIRVLVLILRFRVIYREVIGFIRQSCFYRNLKVVTPTSVSFYARQPVADALHGTINMESLLINVNAPIIRSISKIMNQLTESTVDVSLAPQTVGESRYGKTLGDDGTDDFWSIKPVKASDIPIPMGQIDYDGMFSA